MRTISTEDPLAIAAVDAIHSGDQTALRRLLTAHPELATAQLGTDGLDGMSRSMLHVVTDWPGHYPNGATTVAALVEAGADVNARFRGPHQETPLHWAASSDDVAVLDALLDAGANIEAAGSVLGGGAPLKNATGFRQWKVAHRLVERGADTDLPTAAALGLLDRTEQLVADTPQPGQDEINHAFWSACHGGQLSTAQRLLDHGADLNWIPDWEPSTPLDSAASSGAPELVTWLHQHGAKTADQLRDDNTRCTGQADTATCWCCGAEYPETGLVRLGMHPEVGICMTCARFLQLRATKREDKPHPSPAGLLRAVLRRARDEVIDRGWDKRGHLGWLLQRIDRHLP